MKVRRRAVVLFLGGSLALSLFASLGATGSIGHLTAGIWPNAEGPASDGTPTDTTMPDDMAPVGTFGGADFLL